MPTYTRIGEYSGHEMPLPVNVDDYLQTKEALESPINLDYFFAMKASKVNNKKSPNEYKQYIHDFVSSYGGAYDKFQVVFNNNDIVDFKKGKRISPDKIPEREVTISKKLTSDYAITWRGFSRPLDREYGIAGGDLIIINLKTNEIMAVQRSFAKARINTDKTNWYYPLNCFELYKNDPRNKLTFKESDNFEYKLSQVKRMDNNTIYKPFLYKVIPNIKDISSSIPDIGNELFTNLPIRNNLN